MRRMIIAAMVCLLIPVLLVNGEEDPDPMIVIYSAGDPVLGEMLANLLIEDDRIDSKVEIITDPEIIEMASLLPSTECIVIYAVHEDQVTGLYTSLSLYLQEGGGLVGIREVCNEPTAKQLATEVFPISANESNRAPNSKGKRARTYLPVDDHMIASGLPETFDILSMGTYLSADDEGNYLPVPGDFSIVYKDEITDSPLVVAVESDQGGRSVAMPGIWSVGNTRVDVYYGNIVADENFMKLFTNSVLWAAKGSTRFKTISSNLTEKIDNADQERQELTRKAEEAERKKNQQRLILLVVVWGGGLVVCGIVVWKLVLATVETG
jgi:hypothetical protein